MFLHRKLRCSCSSQNRILFGGLLGFLATISAIAFAHAHGLAGNRLFPGTFAFDDPAVMDEFALSMLSRKHPATDGSRVTDSTVNWSFQRLLTPNITIGVDSGYIRRNWESGWRSGFDTTSLTLKALLYKNDPHEMLISTGLSWGIGGSGARGVGAGRPDTIQPGLFFGKGFGDLPDSLAWLRPFAITGAVGATLPMSANSTILGFDRATGLLTPTLSPNVEILHWGFSIQYSTYYLTSRFTGGPPKAEPLRQLIPLIEFAFDSPKGQKTVPTMNPGFVYVADTYQVGVEAVLPLSSEAGRNVGVKAQLLLFTDDLFPSLFGKPLLSR